MTTLNDLNGYLDDEAYTVRVGELRALLATPAPLSDEPVAEEKLMEVANRVASEFRELAAKLPPDVLANLFAANPSDKQEAVAEIVRYETLTGHTAWDIKIRDKSLKHGTLLYAAPLAQSAEQSGVVDDLRMLVQRLVHALNKASPDNDLGAKALDYLVRKGLTGSILRDDKSAEQDHAALIAETLHYPDHWDTAAYSDVWAALQEVMHSFQCSECRTPNESAEQDRIDAVVLIATKHISDPAIRLQTDKEIRSILAKGASK